MFEYVRLYNLFISVVIFAQVTMSHAEKLRKLDAFRRSVPYVSASALDAILSHAKTDMPDVHNRNAMRRARDMQVNEVTPYGALMATLQVEKTDGSFADLKVINPFAQLWVSADRCESFSEMLSNRLATHPCTYDDPWNFVLYSDEVVPGNQLSFHNLRKCWVLYFSFLEFEPDILCIEDAWFCTAAERSSRVKDFIGGIAQVFKVILEYVFAIGGHSLSTAGLVLNLPNGPVRIWARLALIIQDGGAHKQVFLAKGESGSKHCLICRTLYSESSGLADEDGCEILTSNLHLFDDMDFATDDDVRGTILRLAYVAANMPSELKMREQACGFNHNKMNMCLEPSLDNIVKPVSILGHDWMHTFVVHGVWNTVLFLLLTTLCAVSGDAVRNLCEYMKPWKLPRRLPLDGKQMADAFTPTRWKSSAKAGYFKCTASEAISMYAIIGCYLCAVFLRAGECVAESRAYLCLCHVLDLLRACAQVGLVTPKQLHDAVDAFLRACLDAGWQPHMHPKFHWCIHLAQELERFGTLLTCWTHERKHRMVKRYSDNMKNTTAYETSILAEIQCQHLHNLCLKSTFDLRIGLQDPLQKCKDRMVDFLSKALHVHANTISTTSKSARVSKFEVVWVGDVVVYLAAAPARLSIGKVHSFVAIDDMHVAVIASWDFQSKNMQQGTVEVKCSEAPLHFRPCQDIYAACIYKLCSNGFAQVIVDCMYRANVR